MPGARLGEVPSGSERPRAAAATSGSRGSEELGAGNETSQDSPQRSSLSGPRGAEGGGGTGHKTLLRPRYLGNGLYPAALGYILFFFFSVRVAAE